MRRLTFGLLAVAAMTSIAVPAEGGLIACPGGGAARTLTLELPGGQGFGSATCSMSARGTPQETVFPSTEESASLGAHDGWFTHTGEVSASGTFASPLAWDAYSSIIATFGVGNRGSASWVAFRLTPQLLQGIWSTSTVQGGGLTRDFIDRDKVVAVPEPASTSMLLVGLGVVGVAAAVRRRRRAMR